MIKKIKDIVVYKDDRYYSTFPNIIKLRDNTLMVAFRQAPHRLPTYGDITHGDPSSKGVYVLSKDNGETWDKDVSIIYDHFFYGVQDPCINYLNDGTILSTFFMWKYGEINDYPNSSRQMHAGFSEYTMFLKDAYSTRSHDQGKTWEKPKLIDYYGKESMNSMRGNIVQLEDDSIILAVSGYHDDYLKRNITILKSTDKGNSWERLNTIPKIKNTFMGEPNLFRTAKGKLVCMLRSHISDGDRNVYEDGNNDMAYMHYSESYDEGKTWSVPKKTNHTSPSPFEAIQLKSGNVLMTYGHRYSPYGIKAVLLDGEMENIASKEAIQIRGCGINHDLGYTRSVQLDNGDIIVVYYMYDKEDNIRHIEATILREE
ncbi:MAG: exo-alpha-sialidase [Clostridia bacterium]|nr:exo-alpha-sialidase [Clostridia bacterium]